MPLRKSKTCRVGVTRSAYYFYIDVSGTLMNILADYHHADLYESLLILFEDRFGWQVYRPTGLDWYRQGLWLGSDDPKVVHQFLDPWPGQTLVGDHYQAQEVPHPSRRHKLVTYEQFRAGRFDFVLASLRQNEHRWQQLADEIGARALLQVGNFDQPVDWSLPHVVLAAARIELQGPGVIYHPEFSLADFRLEPLDDPRRITNLTNCLPQTGRAFADFLALRMALPEFTFREHGINGRDGIVSPSAAVAAAMRAAGWAFHNKPVGDGYGFVIHQWAASGRPLIGRARYYAGQLAEPLWEHGVTSIDLSVPDAVDLIREISEDPERHRRLCEAGARRFREIVDFDAEAARIRELVP